MQGSRRPTDFHSSLGDPFGGRSLISTFFNRDPFSDPFFNRPFAIGSDEFFRHPFGERGDFIDQRLEDETLKSSRRGPVIEELLDDHEDATGTHSKSSQEPIIEDPDDNDNEGQRCESGGQRPNYSRSVYESNNNSKGRQPQSQTFSFQSSSVTYGGPNGAYYTSSTTRRTGPDGVTEEEHREADATTGNAVKRMSRGIRDKGHSFTKKRSSDGRVDVMETLHNLHEGDL
eukprot:Gb_25365 [translate_table: standard]